MTTDASAWGWGAHTGDPCNATGVICRTSAALPSPHSCAPLCTGRVISGAPVFALHAGTRKCAQLCCASPALQGLFKPPGMAIRCSTILVGHLSPPGRQNQTVPRSPLGPQYTTLEILTADPASSPCLLATLHSALLQLTSSAGSYTPGTLCLNLPIKQDCYYYWDLD